MQIGITVDSRQARDFLFFFSRQIPFATSKALNAVANDFQRDERDHIEDAFTLRRKQFILRTVKIDKADRATKTKLNVRIHIDTSRDFLAKFEAGGQKTPRGAHRLAVPSGVKRTKTGIISKRDRPRNLNIHEENGRQVGLRRTFEAGGYIFKRTGRGKSSKVTLLYSLKHRVPIPASLDFESTARRTVDRMWGRRMLDAIDYAIRTAR